MWPYLTGSILVAYMASLKIYKILYIVTAAVLLMLPLFVRISWLGFRNFAVDARWFILYWIAVVLSVVFSINPAHSQFALMADAIYPCVFLIFYTVGRDAPYDAIERMMRLLVWAALAVLLTTIDIKVQGRIGYRLIFILPYIVPFVVAAICRGNRLAIAELAVLMALMLLTNSRAQIAATLILAALSLLVFRTSLRQFVLQSASIAAALVVDRKSVV